jgi:NTP pyrophosphatase (non-canonical NTP hydrolase)
MLDINQVQKRIYKNKKEKCFNVTDIYKEFCYLQRELTEACEAYMNKKDNIGEELADVAIYLLGLSEILNINLEDEINKKMDKNENKQYTLSKENNTRITDDADNCYVCEHGYLHRYNNLKLEEYENDLVNIKSYSNLEEMWDDLDSEDDIDDENKV